jgi:ceramide glucosyltransferase
VTALALIAAALACVGIAQCLFGLVAVKRFALGCRAARAAEFERPPVTVLRPLCGHEPLLEEALESCFLQDYPDFQIVLGIQDPADPALAVVEKLRRAYPSRDVALVVDSTMHGPNRKISNLINMLPAARHDVLVISDSDLHLPRNYLDRLVAELAKPGTGLVTALYVGAPPARTGCRSAFLGATQISHGFLPGVLMSRLMGRQDCLGSTTMFTRETLERTGGFHPLVQVLAEDNVFGQRVRELGLSIGLADVVPAATVPEPNLPALWQHELRWTRTIRELAPGSLCASILQYPLFWSMIAVLASAGAPEALTLFLSSLVVRAGCTRLIDAALADRVGRPALPTPLLLLPLRDLLSVVEIAASFCVDEVVWRGHKMTATGVCSVPVQGTTGDLR